MTPRINGMLRSFHHRVYHQLTGKYPHRDRNRNFRYPPLVMSMAEAGPEEVETYVAR